MHAHRHHHIPTITVSIAISISVAIPVLATPAPAAITIAPSPAGTATVGTGTIPRHWRFGATEVKAQGGRWRGSSFLQQSTDATATLVECGAHVVSYLHAVTAQQGKGQQRRRQVTFAASTSSLAGHLTQKETAAALAAGATLPTRHDAALATAFK